MTKKDFISILDRNRTNTKKFRIWLRKETQDYRLVLAVGSLGARTLYRPRQSMKDHHDKGCFKKMMKRIGDAEIRFGVWLREWEVNNDHPSESIRNRQVNG